MNRFINTKLNIKKINNIMLLSIIPLVIAGFYKNGIKLYTQGLVNLFGMFKPLIFDILGIVIGMIVPFIYDRYMVCKILQISYSTYNMYIDDGIIKAMDLIIDQNKKIID